MIPLFVSASECGPSRPPLARETPAVPGDLADPNPFRPGLLLRSTSLNCSGIEEEAAMALAAARMESEAPILLQERDDSGVLRLTLNRPAARNALSIALMQSLIEALDEAAGDRRARVVVIAGSGPAFCAGHDLREIRTENKREAFERIFALCSALMLKIVRLPK